MLPIKPKSAALPPPIAAALVDMEAAAIGRLAAMRGIPFYCIKGVSDGLTDNLPDFNRFIVPCRPVPDTLDLTLFALFRPCTGLPSSEWAKIVERLPKASRSRLLDFLDE